MLGQAISSRRCTRMSLSHCLKSSVGGSVSLKQFFFFPPFFFFVFVCFFSPPDLTTGGTREVQGCVPLHGNICGSYAAVKPVWGFSFSCSLSLVFSWSKVLPCSALVVRSGIPVLEGWCNGKRMRGSALQPWEQTLHFIQMPLHTPKEHFSMKTQAGWGRDTLANWDPDKLATV